MTSKPSNFICFFPVFSSGLAVGLLQVSLYQMLLPYVGVDYLAFLLSIGLFFLGYSLTALFGERLAGKLHLIEMASGAFSILLATTQFLFADQIFRFDESFIWIRFAGLIVYLLAGLLQGPILAAYPHRVGKEFLDTYKVEAAAVATGALLGALWFFYATPLHGLINGGLFALIAGIMLTRPRFRPAHPAESMTPSDGKRVTPACQLVLFAAGALSGCLQYALFIMGEMWLRHSWLIPALVIAGCVAAISREIGRAHV